MLLIVLEALHTDQALILVSSVRQIRASLGAAGYRETGYRQAGLSTLHAHRLLESLGTYRP